MRKTVDIPYTSKQKMRLRGMYCRVRVGACPYEHMNGKLLAYTIHMEQETRLLFTSSERCREWWKLYLKAEDEVEGDVEGE